MNRHVFLTTLSSLSAQRSTSYYYSEEGAERKYFSGSYSTVPGAKKVLSTYAVDRIVVLGSEKTYDPEDLDERMQSGRASLRDALTAPDTERPETALSLFRKDLAAFLCTDGAAEPDPVPIPKNRDGQPAFSEREASDLIRLVGAYLTKTHPGEPSGNWFLLADRDSGIRSGIREIVDRYFTADYVDRDGEELPAFRQAVEHALTGGEPFADRTVLTKEDRAEINEIMRQQPGTPDETARTIERQLSEIRKSHRISLMGKQFYCAIRYSEVKDLLATVLASHEDERKRQRETEKAIEEAEKATEEAEERIRQRNALIRHLWDLVGRLNLEISDLSTQRIGYAHEYVKQYLYAQMDGVHKGVAAQAIGERNLDAELRFIPVDDQSSIDEIVRQIRKPFTQNGQPEADETISLLIDMQGGTRTDGYVRNAVLSILNNDNNDPITIERVFATNYLPQNYTNEIADETSRYSVTDLVAGMNAFLRYGKADLIDQYVKSHADQNTASVNRLVNAMIAVDQAVSLCNTMGLPEAIRGISEATADGVVFPALFSVLVDGIKKDYGKLLRLELRRDVDFVELLAWCLRKGFIQQAITIIEALFPDYCYANRILWTDRNGERRLREWYMRGNDRYIEKNKTNEPLPHYLIKKYSFFEEDDYPRGNIRFLVGELQKTSEGRRNADEAIRIYSNPRCGAAVVEDLLTQYFSISQDRNKLNHAAANERDRSGANRGSQPSFDGLTEKIKKLIDSLRVIKQNA